MGKSCCIKKKKMNKRDFTFVLFLIILQCTLVFAQVNSNGEQKSTVFESKNISTKMVELSPSFSSSGTELYFARSNSKWGTGALKSSIYYSVKKNNKWSTPKLVSFSGKYNDSDPYLTRDGKTMFFISQRPSNAKQISADIWMTEKDNMGNWGKPFRLNNPINSSGVEYSPCTDKNGNLYFASMRSGGYGQGDLYIVKNENGKYTAPTNMGNTLNSSKGEWNLEISGDGKLIIFEASERAQNLSSYGDLYISFKLKNKWTTPQNIKELNTTGSDLYPHLVNKEKVLYFISSDSLQSTNTDIYFTDFKAIYNKYKKNSVLPKK